MTSTDYSDATPDVIITYEPLGRQSTVTQANQSQIAYAYDPANLQLDTETIRYDLDRNGTYDFTRLLDRSRDTLNRDTGFQLLNGTTLENQATYQYQPTTGRLASVSGGGLQPPSPANTFTYNYLPNSNLIQTLTGPIHTTTNIYEPNRDILDTKQNKVGSSIISNYDYAVNAIGQRTSVATSGTEFPALPTWLWGYDSLGQVTRADSSVNANDRAYQFDTIGNRKKAANSLTLPPTDNYTSNILNQYSNITQGSVGVSPEYDFDGNMTFGPLPTAPNTNSTLTWDAENRLISTTVGTTTTTYQYDSQSRRIAKTTGTTILATIYDSWNPVATYKLQNSSFILHNSLLWGTDLSGTLQGAGGVGGLLLITDYSALGTSSHFPTYDGNGNVSEYLDATGTDVAHFEYDPFGNTIVNTDSAGQFNYRFSTKPRDSETGLYYYGYRYYDPLTGRWPSRDPIDERGGLNLYGFVKNDGIHTWDFLGLCDPCPKNHKIRDGSETQGCNASYRTKTQNGTPGTNGCSGPAPDTGPGGANFKSACDRHDKCYDTCGKSRSAYDDAFLNDLYNQCLVVNGGLQCELAAGTMYRVVQLRGKVYYESAQDTMCEWKGCCKK